MKLFLDSSAFIARFNRRDQYHRESLSVLKAIIEEKLAYRKLYTSNYILDEAVTFTLYRTKSHSAAVNVLDAITKSDYIDVLWVTPEVQKEAVQLFKKYSDHFLSITDCTSAVLMSKEGIKDIFTFDGHFESLGFKVIPHRNTLREAKGIYKAGEQVENID